MFFAKAMRVLCSGCTELDEVFERASKHDWENEAFYLGEKVSGSTLHKPGKQERDPVLASSASGNKDNRIRFPSVLIYSELDNPLVTSCEITQRVENNLLVIFSLDKSIYKVHFLEGKLIFQY